MSRNSWLFSAVAAALVLLVLLGALSAILMSLVADAGLRLLTLVVTGAETR